MRAIAPPAPVQLGIVCADPQLAEEEAAMLRERSRAPRLVKTFEAQRGLWDIAVLDTPPALGALTDAAMRAADAVLVPVAADYLAVEALRATLDGIRSVERERDMRYRPLAILPTMVHARRSGSRAAAALLRERFGDLVLPDDVPYSARLDSSALLGVPLVARESGSPPALAYRSAARGVLGQLGAAPPKRKGAVRDFVRADMRSALQKMRRAAGGVAVPTSATAGRRCLDLAGDRAKRAKSRIMASRRTGSRMIRLVPLPGQCSDGSETSWIATCTAVQPRPGGRGRRPGETRERRSAAGQRRRRFRSVARLSGNGTNKRFGLRLSAKP